MIKIKPKPCKGVGVALGCGCGKVVLKRKYGLGYSCGCFYDWYKNSIVYKKKEHTSKSGSELKTALEATKKIVHKYVRLRDKGKPCISCGKKWKSDFQAGHFFKAELYLTLKFHLHNIHGQCPECNNMKEGNLIPYSENLPNRIGLENFTELEKIASKDKLFTKVWDVENLQSLQNSINVLIQENGNTKHYQRCCN